MTHPSPQRIQLRRTKGWRKPDNTVVVARPSRWGNPWILADLLEEWQHPETPTLQVLREAATESFQAWLAGDLVCDGGYPADNQRRDEILRDVGWLRGKNLACWCPLPSPGQPDHCHAAVLLALVNSPTPTEGPADG